MLDRPRLDTLALALGCFALSGLLLVLVSQDAAVVAALDERSSGWQAWVVDAHWIQPPLRWVEWLFGTAQMTLATLVLAGAMLARRHHRAALFTVAVMVATSLVTTLVKLSVGRGRPPWQSPQGLLETHSFPSGHASSVAAFTGVVVVLVSMLVRRARARRLLYAVMLAVVLLVCLDRVLLGRHYPSDVLAGALLGVGMVFLGLTFLNPLPRASTTHDPALAAGTAGAPRLAVILNPAKVEDVAEFQDIVAALAAAAGWRKPRWFLTSVDDPGTGMAEAAAIGGADLVMVCGGDGTVREVCAELAQTGIPVGIVPAGTGNLLARNLGIPLFLRSAVDVALNGQNRPIDLVSVSGDGLADTHFMVMAGMGFDAAMMEGVDENLKHRVGWVAYVLSGFKSLMFPAVRFDISIDGGDFTRHRARTVVVGNVGFLQAGLPLLPDAVVDDGLLDVVILHPRTFFSWIPVAWRVLLKLKHTDETVNRMTGSSVVIRTSGDTPRQLDGDYVGVGRELRMQCLPGRVLVRVPR